MSLLKVKGLTITVKGITVVKDLNFSIEKNKTVAIIGESGSGKTVTALSIMSLLDKTKFLVQGSVLFLGEDLLKKCEKDIKKLCLEKIAIVHQNPFRSLSPVEKIKTNIANIYKIKKRKIENNLLEYLFSQMQLDMNKTLNKYPYECSGGELQRVMMLLSLLFKPRLLICDEVTSSLDYETSLSLISLLKALKEKNNMSLLFISHDISIVKEIADEVLIMKDGKIVEAGLTKEIFKNPKTNYTHALIKASYLEKTC